MDEAIDFEDEESLGRPRNQVYRDTDYLAYYHRALVQGYAIIAVVTHDHATRGKVRTLLKTYGAHAMTYFGQFVTEVWEG
jgi:hypothetical protein